MGFHKLVISNSFAEKEIHVLKFSLNLVSKNVL